MDTGYTIISKTIIIHDMYNFISDVRIFIELKDMLAHSKDIGYEENHQEFCRKFYYYLAAKRYEAAKAELEALLKEISTVRDELAVSLNLPLPDKLICIEWTLHFLHVCRNRDYHQRSLCFEKPR